MTSAKISQVQGKRLIAPEMHEDPYAVYRELRDATPVLWDESLGSWVLTRYDDVAFVMNDPRFSSNRIAAAHASLRTDRYRPLLDVMSHRMSEVDEPDHTRLRSLVNKAFAHVAVEQWKPKIRQRVEELIDGFRETGRCEFVEDFAIPLPLLTILELVGVPAADRRQVKQWCDDFALVALNFYAYLDEEQAERGLSSIAEFREYLEGRIETLRRDPQDNLLSALIAVEQDGRRLSSDELLANTFLLLSAGNETSTCLLANGLLALLRHPAQMQQLRDDPSLVPQAVEEFLRFDSPVQYLGRLATADVELRSQVIRKGDLVLVVLAAANRDPRRFDDPDALNIRRSENHHLAFGHGRHFCVGAQFARLEARLAFEALLQQTSEIALDAASADELSHQDNYNIRRIKQLPLRLTFASS
ncbi:MAG: cytochrome P450 [Planctomycetales bacterium]|nr:cytochrome P450 [Planctomycetales bacterium]